MFRRIILTVALLASLSIVSAKDKNIGNWQIVPLPQEVKETGESPFQLTAKTTIRYAAGDEKQKKDADFLSAHIKEVTGIEVKTTTKPTKSQISLVLNVGDDRSEAYSILANKSGITISATSHVGLFHGIQSIMKALPITKGENVKSVSLPGRGGERCPTLCLSRVHDRRWATLFQRAISQETDRCLRDAQHQLFSLASHGRPRVAT